MLTFSSPGVVVKTVFSLIFSFRLVSGGTLQTESKTSCGYLTVLKLISFPDITVIIGYCGQGKRHL